MTISSINTWYNNTQLYGNYTLKDGSATEQTSSALRRLSSSAYGQTGLSGLSSVLSEVMQGLGLNSDSSITFREIVKYRDKLKNDFDEKMRADLEKLAGSEAFEAKLKKAIQNASGSEAFEAKLKADLRALAGGDEFDAQLRDALREQGVSDNAVWSLEKTRDGSFRVISDYETKAAVESFFAEHPEFAEKYEQLRSLSEDFSLTTDSSGNLLVQADDPQNKALIEDYFAAHPEMARQFKDIKALSGSFSLKMTASGAVAVVADDPATKTAVENFLADHPDLAEEFRNIKGLGDFQLVWDRNGEMQVIAEDKNTKALVEQYLKDNPDMLERYAKINSLTNMEEARKEQNIDVNALRTRIQIESMTAWFMNTGRSVGSIMDFSGADTSLLAGLNKRV